MLRFAAPALALLVVLSVLPLATSEAGNRTERHRVIKHGKFKMVERGTRWHHGRHVRRLVNRNVVVVKVNGDRFSHRQVHRHRQANSYSGDVVIDVRNGVGQWSYGAYSSDIASVTTATPSLKIIDVGTLKSNGACDMKAGVCVIRP